MHHPEKKQANSKDAAVYQNMFSNPILDQIFVAIPINLNIPEISFNGPNRSLFSDDKS